MCHACPVGAQPSKVPCLPLTLGLGPKHLGCAPAPRRVCAHLLTCCACPAAQAGQKGVRVRRVEPTAPVNQVLGTGDILLAFDGTDIANDGTVPFRSGERISFSYLVSRKYTGDEV